MASNHGPGTMPSHVIRVLVRYAQRSTIDPPLTSSDRSALHISQHCSLGSPISQLLANLLMNYAFDRWMDREFPGCPFERYADDVVAHCNTEAQARTLLAAIAERFKALGLELHPLKTKVVYCKDANRVGDFESTSFDFLGYTFRGRLARGRKGFFVSFLPAMSSQAKKAKGQQIRAWHLNRRVSTDLSSIAKAINALSTRDAHRCLKRASAASSTACSNQPSRRPDDRLFIRPPSWSNAAQTSRMSASPAARFTAATPARAPAAVR